MIVVLKGTSSSGKSALTKAMQDALPRPALHVGIDTSTARPEECAQSVLRAVSQR